MDAALFFSKVLPHAGQKILAELVQYTTKDGERAEGWRYKTFLSFDDMASAAAQFDAQGRTVYHACHGYGDWYMDEQKKKKRLRTAVNVQLCRALYDDIDVGKEDSYVDIKEAMGAVRELVKQTGLPSPLVLYSGGGVHLYWPLTEDVTPEAWLHLSAMKRRITAHLGIKVDRAVDMDLARVLRPVGSVNRKYSHKPVVVAKNDPAPTSPEILSQIMSDYIAANDVPHARLPVGKAKMKNAFGAALENQFPESHAEIIAEHCAQIRWFMETGAPDEPVWHKCLGVVKHCEGGEAVAHNWSSVYAEYNPAATQMKLDAWTAGPATCAVFQQLAAERCVDCASKKQAEKELAAKAKKAGAL